MVENARRTEHHTRVLVLTTTVELRAKQVTIQSHTRLKPPLYQHRIHARRHHVKTVAFVRHLALLSSVPVLTVTQEKHAKQVYIIHVITCLRIHTAPAPCSPNPCQNGGNCAPLGTTYSCTCINGYTGIKCDIGWRNALRDIVLIYSITQRRNRARQTRVKTAATVLRVVQHIPAIALMVTLAKRAIQVE